MDEFVLEWTRGSKKMAVTAPTHSSLKTKLLKYAEQYPDDVTILAENEDGSIFAHVPVKWLKVTPPRKISEEQRLDFIKRFHPHLADSDQFEEEDGGKEI